MQSPPEEFFWPSYIPQGWEDGEGVGRVCTEYADIALTTEQAPHNNTFG